MTSSLRQLRRRLVVLLAVYCLGGAISQKLIPGVDEIIPFTGWSLFSKVPNLDRKITLLIERQDGRTVEPPTTFLRAPATIVAGNRYLARKLIQRLGKARMRGKVEQFEELRAVLERNYLRGVVRYELIAERYQPMRRWLSGEVAEQRSLGVFESANRGGDQPSEEAAPTQEPP